MASSYCLLSLFFDGIGAFVIGLSQISSFFSLDVIILQSKTL